VLSAGVLELRGQSPKKADPFQKISFERKDNSTCTIPADGEVTALVKNGVELSVTEDFDCDGVADAYDNCVGMPNPAQIDSDGNGIGDVCEAAVTIKASAAAKSRSNKKAAPPAKSRSNKKPKSRKARAAYKHPRTNVRSRRRR
jgi:hypothetical protein